MLDKVRQAKLGVEPASARRDSLDDSKKNSEKCLTTILCKVFKSTSASTGAFHISDKLEGRCKRYMNLVGSKPAWFGARWWQAFQKWRLKRDIDTQFLKSTVKPSVQCCLDAYGKAIGAALTDQHWHCELPPWLRYVMHEERDFSSALDTLDTIALEISKLQDASGEEAKRQAPAAPQAKAAGRPQDVGRAGCVRQVAASGAPFARVTAAPQHNAAVANAAEALVQHYAAVADAAKAADKAKYLGGAGYAGQMGQMASQRGSTMFGSAVAQHNAAVADAAKALAQHRRDVANARSLFLAKHN